MSKIPTYKAVLDTDEDGIYCISFVSNPATQVDMICFNEDAELRFADEEKHMVTSVVMLADTKIYRNAYGGCYVYYTADTLSAMCEKMLNDNTFNNISFEHDGNIIDKGNISLVELYQTSEHNKSPFNIPAGSIVATYKVHNDDIWELFKSGEIGGISLEGVFSLDNTNLDQKYMNEKIKNLLMRIFTNFAETTTDKGIIYYDGEELVEGVSVTNEEGEPVEDGKYMLEDGTELTIENSVITSVFIPEPEVETETQEQTTEDETETETETTSEDDAQEQTTETETTEEVNSELDAIKAENEELKAKIDELTAENEELKAKIEALESTPATQSVQEEFENNLNQNDKFSRIGSYLKK